MPHLDIRLLRPGAVAILGDPRGGGRSMTAADFDEVVEQNHRALDAFARGDHEPLAKLWSRQDDVTLGNPFGPFVRGFEQVVHNMPPRSIGTGRPSGSIS